MKQYANINYALRPKSYWDDQDALRAALRNVKGTQRRRMITDYWNAGRLAELEEELLKDTLSDDAREGLSKIHPAFMGGEYLPNYRATEVEIARIELASTTSDVISIRAQRAPRGIRYRVVDEYDSGFHLPFKTSTLPLSLEQLIKFIEGCNQDGCDDGLAICYNNSNAEELSRKEMRHFTTISSDFYPQLYDHFEHVFDDWVSEEEDEESGGGPPAQRNLFPD